MVSKDIRGITVHELTFSLSEASDSSELRCPSIESISSMKIIEGCSNLAIENKARTSFSLSPTYLDTKEEALIEKKVPLHSEATAFAALWLVRASKATNLTQ